MPHRLSPEDLKENRVTLTLVPERVQHSGRQPAKRMSHLCVSPDSLLTWSSRGEFLAGTRFPKQRTNFTFKCRAVAHVTFTSLGHNSK